MCEGGKLFYKLPAKDTENSIDESFGYAQICLVAESQCIFSSLVREQNESTTVTFQLSLGMDYIRIEDLRT